MKTKNSLINVIVLIFMFSAAHIFSQNTQAQKGQTYSHVGIGIVPTYLMDGGKIIVPPVTVGGDYIFAENFSIGLQTGYSISEMQKEYQNIEQPRNYRNSSYFTSMRFAVHCTKIKDWDIYGGWLLGFNVVKIEVLNGIFDYPEHHAGIVPKDTKMTYTGLLGVRYGCCSNIGVFAELGFGESLFKIGMSYRL